jgi:preprotein translocase subunit SecG
MGIVIGILTGILVILCIFLVLIILMQKSKQEAGLGAAFGGAATEQLFGAGTTSVLTKATIWGTAMFFVITLILAIYYSHMHKKSIRSKVLSAATNDVPALVAAPSTNKTTEAKSAEASATTAATNAAETAVKAATNAAPALTETNAPATK